MLDDVIKNGVGWTETDVDDNTVCYFETCRVYCKDGFSFSASAGKHFSSTPKSDTGPYLQIEVAFPSERPEPWGTWKHFSTDSDEPTQRVYEYVPVDLVRKLVKKHGGEVKPPKTDPVREEDLPSMHRVKATELRPTLKAMLCRDQENSAAVVLSSRFFVYSPLDGEEEFLAANCGDEDTSVDLAKVMLGKTGKSVVIRFPSQLDKKSEVVTTVTATLLTREDWETAHGDTDKNQWPWSEGLEENVAR